MRADRVEIAQKDNVPFRLRRLQIGQNLLEHTLCPSVGVGALSLRTILRHRDHRRFAVNRSRRRENHIGAAMPAQLTGQHKRPCNVVVVILQRKPDRFVRGFQSRKMNAAVKFLPCFVLVSLYRMGKSLPVPDIRFIKGNILPDNFGGALERLFA